MLNFALWLATTVSFKKGGVVTHNQKPIKPKQKLETLPKLENMCQMTVNKQEKFHEDRTIGGAVTVKKPSKTQYFNCT